MIDVTKYLETRYDDTIDYSRFSKNNISNDEEIFSNIRKFIADNVSDILLIKIEEDKIFLTKKEIAKLPWAVRQYLRFSEHRGIKMYVFNTKDWWFKNAIGVFGWSTGRANEEYFDQIINDEKYKNITTTVSVKLTELLGKK